MHEEDNEYYADLATSTPPPRPRPLLTWGGLMRPWRRSTAAAASEWMGYYAGLYTERGPDPDAFARLLSRNGFWHIPNPYREGHEDHYRFHPDGVTLSDIDFVLGRWSASATGAISGSDPDVQPAVWPNGVHNTKLKAAISQNWSTLLQHRSSHPWSQQKTVMSVVLADRQDWFYNQARWHRDAVLCLLHLFAQNPLSWSWIASILHRHNLVLLMRDVLRHAQPQDKSRLVSAWSKAGWATTADVAALLNTTTT